MTFGKNIQEPKRKFDSFLQLCIRDGIKLKGGRLAFSKTTVRLCNHTLLGAGIKSDPEYLRRIVGMRAREDME